MRSQRKSQSHTPITHLLDPFLKGGLTKELSLQEYSFNAAFL